MNRNKALKIANPLLGLAFVGQILTVTAMNLLEEGGSFLGLPAHDWMETHEAMGISLLALAALHLALNWNWILANLKGR
jgi:cytochrome b561